jgi:hypothetical protein
MIELTDEMARKIERASQILGGLTRAAPKNGGWVRRNPDLHSEILDLQSELALPRARSSSQVPMPQRKGQSRRSSESNRGISPRSLSPDAPATYHSAKRRG